jgi:membrane protein DedA with SNARE-associated domain
MHEPRDTSLGSVLGAIAVAGGTLWLGLGFASAWKGQGTDGVDGILFGGLAFVAGCVILRRRARRAKSKHNK